MYIYIWVFPEMAYTKFMITCMLHFRESYPESCPRIIPANHTTNHTHDFNKGGRNIPRNIPPKHTSETYLESYPLMQHALLGTEFSERAICYMIYILYNYTCVYIIYFVHKHIPAESYLGGRLAFQQVPEMMLREGVGKKECLEDHPI